MASIVSEPTQLCFSSMIGDIVFRSEDENGELEMAVTAGGERTVVLEEVMYPYADGTIVISDIAELVEVYARQHLQITLECTFRDSAGQATMDPVKVLFGTVDVGTTATDFVENHFLTILDGEKITAAGRAERLYAYGASQVTVKAVMLLANGDEETLVTALNPFQHVNGTEIYSYDVSPDNIVDLFGYAGAKVQSYSVEAGSRQQEFLCLDDQVPPAPSLAFINSFGCMELLHCVGTHKKDSKYERLTGRVKGKLRSFKITEDRQFTANTGWLNTPMADWCDDLFRSEEVQLWVNDGPGREVVISDSKSEITNEDDHMPAFEFSYSYAQRVHNVMEPTRAGRIFDNTFDHTFN